MKLARQLRLDPAPETMGKIFGVGVVVSVGVIVTLIVISQISGLTPFLERWLGSDWAFRAVVLAWAAIVPALAAVKFERPYLLIAALLFAVLGLGGGWVALVLFAGLTYATYRLASPTPTRYGRHTLKRR